MKAINPATGELIQEYKTHSPEEVRSLIEKTHQTFESWKKRSVEERTESVRAVGKVLLARKEELGKIISLEMGKTISEGIAEVEKCATNCEYYAQNARTILQDEHIKTEALESYISFKPLGVVLAIMPWNFPFWQAMRFAAPALCAGNSVVLKHASNVPGCALALEKVFLDAGLPPHAFSTLLISSKEVESVIKHPLVKAVTLTGSTAAGRSVASHAGQALKKTVLELGGSDAYLILEDADLDHAAKTLVKARLMNAGQSCISPKRLIVMRAVYQEFVQKVLTEIKKINYGNPLERETQMGCMARADLREDLHRQILKSIVQGAKCLHGGVIPEGKGAYYPPTLLIDLKPGMPAFDEELFGPVVCLIEAQDEAHAIKLANMSPYGLGSGIFTKDLARAQRLAEEGLETGGCFINDFLKSDPRLPFGGVKESGYGRELSPLGLKEFVNAKTIVVTEKGSGATHRSE